MVQTFCHSIHFFMVCMRVVILLIHWFIIHSSIHVYLFIYFSCLIGYLKKKKTNILPFFGFVQNHHRPYLESKYLPCSSLCAARHNCLFFLLADRIAFLVSHQQTSCTFMLPYPAGSVRASGLSI